MRTKAPEACVPGFALRIMTNSSSIHRLSDTHEFIASLGGSIASLPLWQDLFDSRRELIVTRAPGRLDLMGGIADYSGSLVLQWPIHNAVHAAIQRHRSNRVRIASVSEEPNKTPRLFEINLDELFSSNYSTLRARFEGEPENHWAAYVAGAFPVLLRERNSSFREGAHILIKSGVPEGKGVSSSAALEVASMQAVATAYELKIAATELALLCHKVENLVVGAPCGVMDQMTAACGEANRLLELLCQPAKLNGTIPLPAELEIWGIDSGIRHSVTGADYRTVRTAAFMGYRIIAELAGLLSKQAEGGHLIIDDQRWKGYLANIAREDFEREYAPRIPERMSGDDFLDRYDGITDTVTSVDCTVQYPVLAATRHPIYENARVNTFAAILKDWRGDEQARILGDLMYESHESYSTCGLDSDGTDALVALVRAAAEDNLYGAKITGGGSGGTVAVLGRRGADEAVHKVAARYREQTGYEPAIICGSSPGASAFGYLKIATDGGIS
jgi:L-arabinokinase